MKIIRLRLDAARLCRWHLWLIDGLRAIGGAGLCVELVNMRPLPRPMMALLALEKALYGGGHALDRITSEMLPAGAVEPCGDPALTISLAGDGIGGGNVMTPLFDGMAGEEGALSAVIDGRAPWLEVMMDGRRVSAGLPAVEEPRIAGRALDNVMARVAEMLAAAARRQLAGKEPCPPPTDERALTKRQAGAGGAARFALASLAAKATARIARLAGGGGEKWLVGYRRIEAGGGMRDSFRLDEEAYAILPDDGRRYYADPFVFVHEGRHFVFVEEYPYATGKGVISVAELDERGNPATPRVVLEEPFHLSYPHVFAHDGEIWMIPEQEAARRVTLYRCRHFPDEWEPADVLLDGVSASDATVWHDGGRWWMLAATRPPHASSWDTLSIHMADALQGPWRAHPADPVLTDARAVRPAGEMFTRGGALYRPAQDCAGGYGRGISLCRIGKLDEECFLQSVERNLRPSRHAGVHTLNAAGGLEVVDFFGR